MTVDRNPRFGPIFDEPAPAATRAAQAPISSCAVVSDRPTVAAAITAALEAHSIACHRVEVAPDFDGAAAALQSVADRTAPIDAVVVALAGHAPTASPGAGWEHILADHQGIVQRLYADAAWTRAAADYSASTDRPIRLVTLTDATTPSGRSRAQASAQVARAAAGGTKGRVTAFGVEHRSLRRNRRTRSRRTGLPASVQSRSCRARRGRAGPERTAGSGCAVTLDSSVP